LVAAIGCTGPDDRLTITIGSQASERVDRLLSPRIDRKRRWIVIHPGATALSRRYPLASFAAVAGQLARRHECQIVWTGSQAEAGMIDEAQQAMQEPSVSLAGRLSVEELAAVIAQAPLVISNNTSAVHLASAAGTPVVDLYALTNPQHTPWRVPNRVLFEDVPCRFCYKSVCPEGHHRCLQGVSPDAVVEAALELLNDTRATDIVSCIVA
jgi:ADP-heptose:LPS heptosyltransferase